MEIVKLKHRNPVPRLNFMVSIIPEGKTDIRGVATKLEQIILEHMPELKRGLTVKLYLGK